VRLSESLPRTVTNKVLKRSLRAERWNCTDPVLWRPERSGPYRALGADEIAALEESVAGRVL
jgi:fatty-acyl-CoA synthase